MKDPSMSDLLVYVLLLTTLLSAPATSSAGFTMRADLTHVDMGRGFTRWELMNRMAARSRARVASLHQCRGHYGRPAATATVVPSSLEYLVHFNLGTPRPQRVALTMDTGSDLIWTQCTPCPVCFDQSSPMFDPSKSSTSRPVWCSDPICRESPIFFSACSIGTFQCFYFSSYGDNSITAGNIYRDTITFKAPNGKGVPVAVPELAFGCGGFNSGSYLSEQSGIAGFGRGPQSLPSQLKVGKFSYCLTDIFGNTTSTVFLGMPDDLRAHSTGPIQSTPIIQNPEDPSKYFLSFEGITVGKTRLPVDKSVFAIKKNGSGGTIIDSGTTYTLFPNAVLRLLQSAFVEQFPHNDSMVLDDGRLCFQLPQGAEPVPPKLIFHLAGADMDLPLDNYMRLVDEDTGVVCLMIIGTEGAKTIIGMFQQQNMHIVYDTDNSKLLFVPAQCDKL